MGQQEEPKNKAEESDESATGKKNEDLSALVLSFDKMTTCFPGDSSGVNVRLFRFVAGDVAIVHLSHLH